MTSQGNNLVTCSNTSWSERALNDQFYVFLFLGILERPNVSPGTPEIAYKIGVLGKSGSGKSRTIRLLSGKQHDSSGYTETVGVHVKDVYWPSQIHGRNHLFKLQFWESGESSAKRFTYLSSVSMIY